MTTVANRYSLTLSGLHEDNPRDFLATLGLFRLIDLLWPEKQARLFWIEETGCPCIETVNSLTENWPDILISQLKELAELGDSPLFHGPVIKTELENYRAAVIKAQKFTVSNHPLAKLPQLLYSSYASQLADENDGKTEPTAFSFANGQGGKNLLRDVAELIQIIQPDELRDSLLGTGKAVAAKSMRWNPREYRPAAYRPHDPGTKLKGDDTLDFPSFNLLALFGLTFFPSVPTSKGPQTLGFEGDYRPTFFRWPIWETPVKADTLSTLVCLPISYYHHSEVGILRTWQSRRFSADKSLYFAPPELLI